MNVSANLDIFEDAKGYAPCLREDEIIKLNVFEGYPKQYRRDKVIMKVFEGGKVTGTQEAEAYVQNRRGLFRYPCKEYLDANEKTR